MTRKRKIIIITLLILSTFVMLAFGASVWLLTRDAHLDAALLPTRATMTIYDGNDDFVDTSDYATLNEISDHIKNAFIAVEDKRFYKHNGIDIKRIGGAIAQDIKSGSFTQGGSTITCQLVKNTHLTNEKTIKRKLREAKIALEMERQYNKDVILEMYLNVIYFGKGIHGIKEACLAYFNKTPEMIDPREAATLAAIVANPTRYSPTDNYEQNQRRADMILDLMRREMYLDAETYASAKIQHIDINYIDFHNNYNRIYHNSLLSELSSLKITIPKSHHLCIYTYLDPQTETAAKNAIEQYQKQTTPSPAIEFLFADNTNGGITAYLSNNTQTPTKKQPGSLLKPFIYASAIQSGNLVPATPIFDAPTSFGEYAPGNYKNVYHGWTDASYALSQSLNVPAVATLEKIGTEIAFTNITHSGIGLNEKDKNLALALGGTTYGSSCPEICAGYMTLAKMGTHTNLGFIRKITDNTGRIIYLRNSKTNDVFDHETAYLTTTMLVECARKGTAKQLATLPFEVAAKTGTVAANTGNSAAWCAGYTTKHTFVCQYSTHKQTDTLPNNVTGGNLPAKSIRCALKTVYQDETPPPFRKPIGIKQLTIDKTLKEELHKLVPYEAQKYGRSETIEITEHYQPDQVDPDALFFADLTIRPLGDGILISYKKLDGIDYSAKINGIECMQTPQGFFAPKQRFPLAKLEMTCKKQERPIYYRSKIIKTGQSLINSRESRASRIRFS